MAWLTANWFWVLIFIAFISMHMFGHGGHGGHGGSGRQKDGEEGAENESPDRVARKNPGGHQH